MERVAVARGELSYYSSVSDETTAIRLCLDAVIVFQIVKHFNFLDNPMFAARSKKPERIDTGDYTQEEFEQFLVDIRFINRYFGDSRALKKYVLPKIEENGSSVSVLDVGAGSGELLRQIADEAEQTGNLQLVGLDYNTISADSIVNSSAGYSGLFSVQGDAFALPFDDSSFEYVISSLFTHHLTDRQIVECLAEMRRVARKEVLVIDLHRHPVAFGLYKLMCVTFGISELVRHDGSLSIRKGFKPVEFRQFGLEAGFSDLTVRRSTPYRLVLTGKV